MNNIKYKNIVDFALENNKFYKKKYNDNFVLTKDDIINNLDDIISNNYDVSGLIKENTSGTSGKTLSVYKTNKERVVLSLALFKERYKVFPSIKNSKCIKFYAYRRGKDDLISDKVFYDNNDINFSLFYLDDESLFEYFDIIKRQEKVWFFCAPSVMIIFSDFIKRYNLVINNVGYIELAGEYVTLNQELFIEKTFNAPVRNFYGSKEVWGIGYECSKHHIHVLGNDILANVIDENNNFLGYGKEGRLVITSFNLKSMPIINYLQGDVVSIDRSHNDCENTNDIINLSGGRITDYIDINGKRVSSIVFFFIIEKINFNQNKILQFQVIQKNNIFKYFIYSLNEKNNNEIVDMLNTLTHIYLDDTVLVKVEFVSVSFFSNSEKKFKYFTKEE